MQGAGRERRCMCTQRGSNQEAGAAVPSSRPSCAPQVVVHGCGLQPNVIHVLKQLRFSGSQPIAVAVAVGVAAGAEVAVQLERGGQGGRLCAGVCSGRRRVQGLCGINRLSAQQHGWHGAELHQSTSGRTRLLACFLQAVCSRCPARPALSSSSQFEQAGNLSSSNSSRGSSQAEQAGNRSSSGGAAPRSLRVFCRPCSPSRLEARGGWVSQEACSAQQCAAA